MRKEMRGRPRLPLTITEVLEAVRKHGTVTAAGRELGCSSGYVHARFGELRVTLAQVLDAPSVDKLLTFTTREMRNHEKDSMRPLPKNVSR